MNQKSNNVLTVKNLTFKIPYDQRCILQDIEFDVQPGDFIVILGANGSGKSSLLKVINKTYNGFKGDIRFGFEEQNIKKINDKEYSKYIATIIQDVNANLFLGLTVLENYKLYEIKNDSYGFSSKGLNAEDDYKSYLKKYNNKLASKLNTHVDKLSGGEKQSLILALTFLHTPTILLLDEHISALDPISGNKLMQFTADKIIKDRITCIMTTHSLDYALKYGNKIIALKNGKIIFHASNNEKAKLTKEDLVKFCY